MPTCIGLQHEKDSDGLLEWELTENINPVKPTVEWWGKESWEAGCGGTQLSPSTRQGENKRVVSFDQPGYLK